ncbi:MAG: amidohydrolase [Candidatus Aminicenantes bacterium]|nr:MAG: amidohydrolase [Candidatus Aminicenantes bacterium]
MIKTLRLACLASALFAAIPSVADDLQSTKLAAVESINAHQAELVELADQVWTFAETALRETRSAAVLADYAEAQGFVVERGVAGMPTAFVASFGEGRPIIGILGEYDALPGISQRAQPTIEPLVPGAAGHGCGHNLLGTASLGAALAIKDLIAAGKLSGTVRYYGTPAEETVGGKLYMLRAGLFDDVDAVLAWHPSNEIVADTEGNQAVVDIVVEFEGRTAHAAYDPWNGRSAADGAEVFTFALNLMREHVRPTVRMHYVVTDAGDVPNVVPGHARVWCWLRDSSHAGVDGLLERAKRIAEGAALATGTTARLTVQSGDWEMLPMLTGAELIHANMMWLGPIEYTAEEQDFARRIQLATDVPPIGLKGTPEPLDLDPREIAGGSTDVGDVSWKVPTLHLSVTTAPAEAPWHAWPVVATGGMSIGHKGMVYAAEVLAATMVDLYADPAKLAAVRQEFEDKTRGIEYVSYLPDGPPPIPVD